MTQRAVYRKPTLWAFCEDCGGLWIGCAGRAVAHRCGKTTGRAYMDGDYHVLETHYPETKEAETRVAKGVVDMGYADHVENTEQRRREV